MKSVSSLLLLAPALALAQATQPAAPPASAPTSPPQGAPSAAAPAQSAAPGAAPQLQPPPPSAGAARVLTLAEAIQIARVRQPLLVEARSAANASRERAGQAFAPLLPQVQGNANYQRATANYAPRAGGSTPGVGAPLPAASWNTFDAWSFTAAASQLVFDFGQTVGRYRAADQTARADAETARETEVQTVLNVRTVYFQARAAKDLVGVARATRDNQEAHLRQIRGFVEVGTRPPIDLAQARANVANAEVQLIQQENNYATARARLNQTIGLEGPIDYDVTDEALPAVGGEEGPTTALVDEAVKARPDIAAAQARIAAAQYSIRSAQGAYGPSLAVQAGASDQGQFLDQLRWNAFAGATLSWQIFQGGLTKHQVQEARANLVTASAQQDQVRQQIRLDVEQAQLTVRAARSSVTAAQDAVTSAREQLRLAEGRYRTGAGSSLELSDAQLAATNAEAQAVQAAYQLATARAQLLAALGRADAT